MNHCNNANKYFEINVNKIYTITFLSLEHWCARSHECILVDKTGSVVELPGVAIFRTHVHLVV